MAIPEAERELYRTRRLAAGVFIAAVVLMLIIGAVVVYFVLQARPPSMDPGRPAQSGPSAPGGNNR